MLMPGQISEHRCGLWQADGAAKSIMLAKEASREKSISTGQRTCRECEPTPAGWGWGAGLDRTLLPGWRTDSFLCALCICISKDFLKLRAQTPTLQDPGRCHKWMTLAVQEATGCGEGFLWLSQEPRIPSTGDSCYSVPASDHLVRISADVVDLTLQEKFPTWILT